MKKWLLLVSLCLGSLNSRAQTYSQSYVVDEASTVVARRDVSPLSAFQNILDQNIEQYVPESFVNILKFLKLRQAWGPTKEKYSRLKHFRSWMRGVGNPYCWNTRELVLARDSRSEVITSSDGCNIVEGDWVDPYSDRPISDPKEIQIDHFVPLKNAYVSGAAQWTDRERCVYSNFYKSSFHLLSVDGQENSRKGDKGPEGYLPPNESYRCQYISQWLQVKLIWSLRLNPDEIEAITAVATEYGCSRQNFMVSDKAIEQARKEIASMRRFCN